MESTAVSGDGQNIRFAVDLGMGAMLHHMRKLYYLDAQDSIYLFTPKNHYWVTHKITEITKNRFHIQGRTFPRQFIRVSDVCGLWLKMKQNTNVSPTKLISVTK